MDLQEYQNLISPESLARSPALAVSAAADWLEENQIDGAGYVRHFAAALLAANQETDKMKREVGEIGRCVFYTDGFRLNRRYFPLDRRDAVKMETGAIYPRFFHPRVREIMANIILLSAGSLPSYWFNENPMD